MKRIITAFVLLPALYYYIMYLPTGYFFILVSLVSFIGVVEFLTMYKANFLNKWFFGLLSVLMLYIIHIYGHPGDIIIVFFIVLLIIRLFIKKDINNALKDLSPYFIGLFYIVLLSYFIVKLRNLGPDFILYFMAVVWGSDASALYIGKAFGKRKLYEAVSPNKTIEGSVGAVFGGIIISLLLGYVFGFKFPSIYLIAGGFIIAVSGIVGDLIESMFKRDAGVKDSGSFLPGHGGMLDKIDGMLLAAPTLYYAVVVFNINVQNF